MASVAALAISPTAPTVQCTVHAAQRFGLPPGALAGVLLNEGGRPGLWSRNANGSYDLGPAQINTLWLEKLRARGITPAMVANDGCLNVTVAAGILALYRQQAGGDLWTALGWYHSHIPLLARQYRIRMIRRLGAALQKDPSQ